MGRAWCSGGPPGDIAPVVMPMLPFEVPELMVPGMNKDLHLYEPRYLRMLQMVLESKSQSFVHVVVDDGRQLVGPGPASLVTDAGIHLCFPVICKIEKTLPLSVGRKVRIKAVSRARIFDPDMSQSFLRAGVVPLIDDAPADDGVCEAMSVKVASIQNILADVRLLTARLPPNKAQADLRRALAWVDSHSRYWQGDDAAVKTELVRAERLSWAALSPPPAATAMEVEELQMRRLASMQTLDTLERLEHAVEWLQVLRASLSARVALASLKPVDA